MAARAKEFPCYKRGGYGKDLEGRNQGAREWIIEDVCYAGIPGYQARDSSSKSESVSETCTDSYKLDGRLDRTTNSSLGRWCSTGVQFAWQCHIFCSRIGVSRWPRFLKSARPIDRHR